MLCIIIIHYVMYYYHSLCYVLLSFIMLCIIIIHYVMYYYYVSMQPLRMIEFYAFVDQLKTESEAVSTCTMIPSTFIMENIFIPFLG